MIFSFMVNNLEDNIRCVSLVHVPATHGENCKQVMLVMRKSSYIFSVENERVPYSASTWRCNRQEHVSWLVCTYQLYQL